MKSFYTIAMAFIALSLNAQIPNADFEAWTSNTWNYTPDGWMTENSQLQEPVTQELDSYEGDYAMRITSVGATLGEYGSATALFDIDYIPASLDFYYKTNNSFGGVGVIITFFNNGGEIAQYDWATSENVDDWTFLSIPMEQIKPVIDQVEIHVYAQVGDLVAGDATIAVDAMGFEGTSTGVNDISTYNISSFPNPANGVLNVQDPELKISSLDIYDITGKLVKQKSLSAPITQIDISDLNIGIYSMVATHHNGQQSAHKLMIAR